MQIRRLKLYHYPALRSARVKWLLHELLGEDFDVEVVSIFDAVQYRREFREMNPNHAVPVLEITLESGERMHMIESGAIIALLADTFAEKRLAPPAHVFSAERADYLQMLHFGGTSMDMMLWQIRIHEHILRASERDERTIQRYRNKFLLEVEPQLKQRLCKAPFICGNQFSAADCMIGHGVMWARAYQMCADAVFEDYIGCLSQREAFGHAFADRHEFVLVATEDHALPKAFTG
jgi:glutathione S-transferase